MEPPMVNTPGGSPRRLQGAGGRSRLHGEKKAEQVPYSKRLGKDVENQGEEVQG